ncbi:purine-binding chemotaxis protein CheW [Peribacillus saganii]|uniref:Purine-binding chemotaxis protein CheW n=1 Tax=Peribacillus saganii TaxID=2303992 RepID=A0A372LS35_9BACI|nr:chemotaxis protein CheW [Peribacillus saganii]RFU71001.1 purine-binding chemotaxis protein CheW [Peribacillus saganii]
MNPLKVIVFQINAEEYAINVNHVYSIEKVQAITRVPGVSAFIKGVVNLRGVVIPVIDLKERFGLGSTLSDDQTRLLIVSWNDLELALVVEAANDVIDIQEDNIEPTPDTVGEIHEGFLQGIVKLENRLFTMLHLEKVLNIMDKHEISHT